MAQKLFKTERMAASASAGRRRQTADGEMVLSRRLIGDCGTSSRHCSVEDATAVSSKRDRETDKERPKM